MREGEKISVTPELVSRFAAYRSRPGNGAWGCLHSVLEDGNLRDKSVERCVARAADSLDDEGLELARVLLRLSPTQRGKLARLCREVGHAGVRV